MQVLPTEGGRHEVGKLVGRAGKDRHAHGGEFRGVIVIVARRARVGEREEADEIYPGCDQAGCAAQHPGRVAAFVEVGDHHERRVGGALNEARAIRERLVDVRAAAELRTEEQINRVLQLRRQIDDRRVEEHHLRRECRQRRQHQRRFQ